MAILRIMTLVFSLLFGLLLFGCAAEDSVDTGDGDIADGDAPDGDQVQPDGDLPDGDEADGDPADGDMPDGDMPDGDMPDGDMPDGDMPDGDMPDGDMPDGDMPDGDMPDGDMPDGDMPDGDMPDGDMPDGDEPDGDLSDGDMTDGDVEIACDGALPLACGDSFSHNTLINGRDNLWQDYACGGGSQTGKETVYNLYIDEVCEVTVTLKNLGADVNLYIMEYCDPAGCFDSSMESGTTVEEVTFSAGAGETFPVAVDGTGFGAAYTVVVSCSCAVDGDTDGDVEGDVDLEGLFGLGPVDGLMPKFRFDVFGDFFSSPWPNDFYTNPDGTIRLDGFPKPVFDINDPAPYLLMNQYLTTAASIVGFGTNTPVYWTFEEAINTATLPAPPVDPPSFSNSSVLLVNIDLSSPNYNKLTPIEWHWTGAATFYEPSGNLLAVAPYDGFPLDPSTMYAMILTDGVTDASNGPLGRSQLMADLYSGKPSGNADLDAVYYPFALWLDSHSGDLDPEKVRAVTVFSTQDPVSETRGMSEYIKAQYPNGAISGALQDCAFREAHTGWVCFDGHYTSPNFQKTVDTFDPITLEQFTDYAHRYAGGQFEFNPSGNPIVQETESLEFAFCVPSDASPPAGGWPIALISHGTTGDYDSYIGTGSNSRTIRMMNAGIATMGIAQPLHGTRCDDLYCPEVDLDLLSYNFINPDSARATTRQTVMDNTALTAFIKAGKLVLSQATCSSWPTVGQYAGPSTIPINTGKIYFHGHSQGGISGAIAAGVQDDIDGWVFSGAGGRISITVMERTDPNILDMLDDLNVLAKEDAYKHHPLLMLVQHLGEITDPVNYSPFWVQKPYANVAQNIMVTTGYLDDQTPKNTTYAMCIAGRVPQILPLSGPIDELVPGLTLLGYAPVARPASNTVTGPDQGSATCGLLQYPTDGHFAIFDNNDAASVYQEFLCSLAYDGVGKLGGY